MSPIQNFGEFISLDEALKYVSDFRKRNPDAIKAYTADGDKLQQVLLQKDCIGLRIYNGYSEKTGANNLVILGVDSAQSDMVSGLILQRLEPCPPNCDPTSQLAKD